jgi:UDP-glucose 4-epimerase
MRRALVTGATGCIGRALTRRLLELGTEVRAIVRDADSAPRILGGSPALELIRCDLFDSVTLRQTLNEVEVVFHLAAKVHTRPRSAQEHDEFFKVNVDGTRILLDACADASVKSFIFFSTIAVFGQQPSPFSESTPAIPITSYAKSKYEAEGLVFEWMEKTKRHAVVLRPAMVFGEGDRGNFQKMIKAIDKGRFVSFGGARKSLAYSADIAEVAIISANTPEVSGQVLIAAESNSYTLQEIAAKIAGALGRRNTRIQFPVWFLRLSGVVLETVCSLIGTKAPFDSSDVSALVSNTACDTSKLDRQLNFRPRFGLSQGIFRTVAWYRSIQQSVHDIQ